MKGDALMHSARAVANSFIDEAEKRSIELTPMKLQKLVYFAHGWYLGITGKPLVNEEIQAWRFGPVIYTLYREFKEFGSTSINRKARQVRVENGQLKVEFPSIEGDNEFKSLVARIFDVYGNYTAIQLSNLTHAVGTPWYKINTEFKNEIPSGTDIPNELILDYFKRKFESAA